MGPESAFNALLISVCVFAFTNTDTNTEAHSESG